MKYLQKYTFYKYTYKIINISNKYIYIYFIKIHIKVLFILIYPLSKYTAPMDDSSLLFNNLKIFITGQGVEYDRPSPNDYCVVGWSEWGVYTAEDV